MTLSIFSIDLGLCLSLERGQERDLVRDLDARLDGIQLHVLTGIQQWQRIYHPPQRHRSGRWPIHDGEGPVGDEFISSQVSGQASWRAATCEWFSICPFKPRPHRLIKTGFMIVHCHTRTSAVPPHRSRTCHLFIKLETNTKKSSGSFTSSIFTLLPFLPLLSTRHIFSDHDRHDTHVAKKK